MASRARLAELLVEKYGVEEAKISPDATMADLGLDSLSVAEMVFDVEELFEIEISPEDAEFTTFGEAVALIDRHVEARGA